MRSTLELKPTCSNHQGGKSERDFSLRYALSIRSHEWWAAHLTPKEAFIAFVGERTGVRFDPRVLTLGFARRFTPHKRAELLLADPGRLEAIAGRGGGLEGVFGGKAHPNDSAGKEIIQGLLRLRETLRGKITLVYVENDDLRIARQRVAGVEVWLNPPLPPMEASGASGMKAALNGGLSLSVLDGWWREGCIEGGTVWSWWSTKGVRAEAATARRRTRRRSMPNLSMPSSPCSIATGRGGFGVMRGAIAPNGSFWIRNDWLSRMCSRPMRAGSG